MGLGECYAVPYFSLLTLTAVAFLPLKVARVNDNFDRRYEQTGESVDLARQVQAVQRSLGQLTRPEDRFPPYRCPESWFWEQGNWIPNDITPLLWTQANLIQALDSLQRSFKLRDENKR